MLEKDEEAKTEGNGTMLFKLLKTLLMILPQGTCYSVLKDRLTSIARFRQTTLRVNSIRFEHPVTASSDGNIYVQRIEHVRTLHCDAKWRAIRADSLEVVTASEEKNDDGFQEGSDRRSWLGYASKDEEDAKRKSFLIRKSQVSPSPNIKIPEIGEYHDLSALSPSDEKVLVPEEGTPQLLQKSENESDSEEAKIDDKKEEQWKDYWADAPR